MWFGGRGVFGGWCGGGWWWLVVGGVVVRVTSVEKCMEKCNS